MRRLALPGEHLRQNLRRTEEGVLLDALRQADDRNSAGEQTHEGAANTAHVLGGHRHDHHVSTLHGFLEVRRGSEARREIDARKEHRVLVPRVHRLDDLVLPRPQDHVGARRDHGSHGRAPGTPADDGNLHQETRIGACPGGTLTRTSR